ncbi:cdc42 homolog [Lineus longissimus]|uniref:cdc42 homolog n=1 Tax=Lineus longissimus TaxID=88925 RepID=UPI002B4E892B
MADSLKYKCVVVGDSAVGKTSMLMTYQHDSFNENLNVDVCDGFMTEVAVEDTPCQLQLVDICVTEGDDYDRIRYLSFYDTDIVIICFSLVDRSSLENVKSRWLPEINQHPSLRSAIYMLVGTKSDLRGDQDVIARLREQDEEPIDVTEGRQVAKDIGAADYVECSSCLKETLSAVFCTAAWHSMQKKEMGQRRRRRRHTWKYACYLFCYACWCGCCMCCCPDKF